MQQSQGPCVEGGIALPAGFRGRGQVPEGAEPSLGTLCSKPGLALQPEPFCPQACPALRTLCSRALSYVGQDLEEKFSPYRSLFCKLFSIKCYLFCSLCYIMQHSKPLLFPSLSLQSVLNRFLL